MSPDQHDAITVLNAGSSSLKLFGVKSDVLRLELHGQSDGLGKSPRFVVKNPDSSVRAQRTWPDGTSFGHDDALVGWVRDELTLHRLLGVGHRVAHGGMQFSAPTRVTPQVLQALQGRLSSTA